jgi:uncharacterized membrane protein YjgN (DUF898 family)
MLEAPPILAPPPAVPEPPVFHRAEFTGTGAEYFRIWIVNFALTIVTLGIYSAWAKVRRMQFFYRHSRVAGAGFDYHASPIALLKGRMVALALFGLYSSMGYVGTSLTIVILFVLAALLPWLLGRSLRFRMHNSSYRGIRFQFHGTTKQAYWIFLGMPLLTVMTLFTLGPMWHHRLKRYQFENSAYGSTQFRFGTPVASFYGAHLLSMAVVGGLLFVFFAAIGALFALTMLKDGGPPAPDAEPDMTLLLPLFVASYVIAVVGGQAITGGRLQNAIWNHTTLGRSTFMSDVHTGRLFWILLTNLLGTIATLGMFRPFAQVRLARYYASCMTVIQTGAFVSYSTGEGDDVAATGEETADIFDFDIGF